MQSWPDTRSFRIALIDTELESLRWLGGPITRIVAEYAVESVMERLFYQFLHPLEASTHTHQYTYSLRLCSSGSSLGASIVKEKHTPYWPRIKSVKVGQETELADAPATLNAWLEPLVYRAAIAETRNMKQSEPRPGMVERLAKGLVDQILEQFAPSVLTGD